MHIILFKISRFRFMGAIVGIIFKYVPFLLPISNKQIYKNRVVLNHPVPLYDKHLLAIPRRVIRSIIDTDVKDKDILVDVFSEAINMCTNNELDTMSCWNICINGGRRQDVRQAHFHLYTNTYNFETRSGSNRRIHDLSSKETNVFMHTEKDGSRSYVFSYVNKNKKISMLFKDILNKLPGLNVELDLVEKGFSIIYNMCIDEIILNVANLSSW